MKQKVLPIIIVLLQLSSLVWYLWPIEPQKAASHAPIEFIELMIFGIANLIIIAIFTLIFFLRKKQNFFVWKLPFIVLFVFLGFLLFYNKSLLS